MSSKWKKAHFIFFPLTLGLAHFLILILTDILPIETPSQITEQSIEEVILLSGIIIPVIEEGVFRGLILGGLTALALNIRFWPLSKFIPDCIQPDFLYSRNELFWGTNIVLKVKRGLKSNTNCILIVEGVFIVISGLVFTLIHDWWGFWKLIPTFLMGLVLGIAFLRYGIFSAISIHIENNLLIILITIFLPEIYYVRVIVTPLITSLTLLCFEKVRKLKITGL